MIFYFGLKVKLFDSEQVIYNYNTFEKHDINSTKANLTLSQ